MSERETRIIPFLAGRGGLCLDVGAAQGEYSAQLLKAGRNVLAFEPLYDIYTADLEPLAAAHPGLTILPYAVSDVPGRATIRVPHFAGKWQPQRASISQDFAGVQHQDFDVPLVRLDDLGLDQVDFIKIDVEGNELSVVLGALELIRRCQPVLLIEMEQRHIPGDLITSIEVIEALGYTSYIYRDDGLVRRSELDLQEIQRVALARLDPATYLNNIVFLPQPRSRRNIGLIAPFQSTNEPAARLWLAARNLGGRAFCLTERAPGRPGSAEDGRFQRMWSRGDVMSPTDLVARVRNLFLGHVAIQYEPGLFSALQWNMMLKSLVQLGVEVSLVVLNTEGEAPAFAAQGAVRRVYADAAIQAGAARNGWADGTVLPADDSAALRLLFNEG